jgi:hypothetical protein
MKKHIFVEILEGNQCCPTTYISLLRPPSHARYRLYGIDKLGECTHRI